MKQKKVRVRDLSDEHTLMGQKRERPQGLFSNARKHSIYVCTTGWAWDWARYAFQSRLEPKIETSGRNRKWNSINNNVNNVFYSAQILVAFLVFFLKNLYFFCLHFNVETEPLPMNPKIMHAIYPLNQDFLLHRLPKTASRFRGLQRTSSERVWQW